jgi:hypothetical protein
MQEVSYFKPDGSDEMGGGYGTRQETPEVGTVKLAYQYPTHALAYTYATCLLVATCATELDTSREFPVYLVNHLHMQVDMCAQGISRVVDGTLNIVRL